MTHAISDTGRRRAKQQAQLTADKSDQWSLVIPSQSDLLKVTSKTLCSAGPRVVLAVRTENSLIHFVHMRAKLARRIHFLHVW